MHPENTKFYPEATERRFSLVAANDKSRYHAKPKAGGAKGPDRILLVGSNQGLCRHLCRLLEAEGLAVTTTANGTDAIFLYHRGDCDVLVSDVALSDMSGIELLKAVKAMDEYAQVILMACYTSFEGLLEALRAGAYDYVLKPAEHPAPLLEAVRRAIRRVDARRQHHGLMAQLRKKTQFLEQTNARLLKMASCDALTGLFNRRYFQECLSAEIDRCQRYPGIFSLLFMDLDHFKTYNDINGHVAGDALLKSLAQMLLKMFRKTDTLVRYGGDEFVAILPQTAKGQALELGEKIRRQVSDIPFKGLSSTPGGQITISIGCAVFPHDGVTCETLLHLADQSLYKSKNARSGLVA